jgi:DNA-binding FrmR family transcriptional regulator
MALPAHKQTSLIALKKARTLLDKIIRMTEENKYCVDIIQHNMATIGLLKSAHATLLEGHMQTCFKHAIASKNKKEQQKVIDEIMQLMKHSPNCLINKVKS